MATTDDEALVAHCVECGGMQELVRTRGTALAADALAAAIRQFFACSAGQPFEAAVMFLQTVHRLPAEFVASCDAQLRAGVAGERLAAMGTLMRCWPDVSQERVAAVARYIPTLPLAVMSWSTTPTQVGRWGKHFPSLAQAVLSVGKASLDAANAVPAACEFFMNGAVVFQAHTRTILPQVLATLFTAEEWTCCSAASRMVCTLALLFLQTDASTFVEVAGAGLDEAEASVPSPRHGDACTRSLLPFVKQALLACADVSAD